MEIERKWLVKYLPDLRKYKKVSYERHFLYSDSNVEIRVQKKGDLYFFERKVLVNNIQRENTLFEISKSEFEYFKGTSTSSLERDSYQVSDRPNISIKVYKGKYEGLVRVEVEFQTVSQANSFQPLEWFGKEITGSEIANDRKLVTLTSEQVQHFIAS